MLIIDERDFIAKAMEQEGLALNDYFEGHQVLSVNDLIEIPLKRRSDVIILDIESLLKHPGHVEQVKALLNTFTGVVLVHKEADVAAREWANREVAFLNKVIGVHSYPLTKLQGEVFSNQLNFFWHLMKEQTLLQKQLADFSQELETVLETAEWEMARAKRIHENLVPKRTEEIKGIQFINKYATGDGGAAEFYDLFQSSQKVFQIFVTSESYLISSALLGILNTHKQKEFDPKIFIRDARADIEAINGSKKKKAQVDLLVVEIDLGQLSMKVHGQSKAEFYGQTGSRVTVPDEGITLKRGEKLIVFSPGFLFNWSESNKQDISSFLKNHLSLNMHDLVSELFFQIRQESSGKFLKKDATIAMMEVNRHGMHQV